MTNKPVKKKDFDCVKMMREIRDQLSLKLAKMTPEEQIRWYNEATYSDPNLQRFVDMKKSAKSKQAKSSPEG